MKNKLQKEDTMKLVINLLKNKTVALLFVLVASLSSCNDWIDIEPENDLIQEEFWKTKDDLMSVVAATYDANRGSTEKSFYMGEVRADFISAKDGDYVSIGNNDISTTNGAAKWDEFYKTINLANTVMFYAPIVQELDKTLTNQIINEIESEMLFLRSLSYFYLVRIWKDVPLVLRPTVSDTVDFYIPKSTEVVVLKQIAADLKKANDLASDDASVKGYANKYAIQALLADVFLWGENYTECIKYCDLIINSGRFSLESKENWFKLYYPGNSMGEAIFELQYEDDLDGQENPFYDTFSWPPGVINNSEIAIGKLGFDVVNDIRYCKAKGPIWKYTGIDETGVKRRSGNARDANYIYYRYADILLIKAEALAETGNFTEANRLVGIVAERAGVTHSATNDLGSFRTALMAERGREFGAEGKRWFDILRFAKKDNFKDKQFLIDIMLSKAGDAQEIAVMKTKVTDTMSYYLPIHQDEIQYNKNLVQNPFYDR